MSKVGCQRGRRVGSQIKGGSSPNNLQVGKGGLPPLERHRLVTSALRLFHFLLICPLRYYPAVAPLTLKRGQATLPNLQITLVPFGFQTVSTVSAYFGSFTNTSAAVASLILTS
jgi:hypothetical protein